MKVSILINNYNYARFVAQAVDSALAQTYSDCEVIVVDDGSTDASREVLEQYSDRVKLIFQRNAGQVSAFNVALAASAGELVAFLDSDDALFPDAIRTVVEAWTPGLAKLQFPLQILNSDGVPLDLLMPRTPLSEGDVLPDFLKTGRYMTAPTSGNVYSRSFLEKVFPIPEKEWDHGDAYLNTCAPFYGGVAAVQSPLGYYRIHGVSMSSIVQGGNINLKQIEKLINHAMQEKGLLEKLASDRRLVVSKDAVVAHWLHLKLRIATYLLSDMHRWERTRLLLRSGYLMIVSTLRAGELSLARKVQNIVWTLGVLMLPKPQATKLLVYAFDTAPRSSFIASLRRRNLSWKT
jgi:glycosyltransferase involved in cell wall biosynthesis